jgi:hypothetical protein
VLRLFFVGIAISMLFSKQPEADVAAGLLGVWLAGETLCSVTRMSRTLYDASPLYVYSLLPLADAEVFTSRFRRHIWRSIRLCLELIAIAVAFGVSRQTSEVSWVWLAGAGVLTTAFVITGALALSVFAPFKHYGRLGLLLIFTAFGLLLFDAGQPGKWLSIVGACFPGALLIIKAVTPSASVPSGLLPYSLILGAVALSASPLAYRKLRFTYSLGEELFTYAHLMRAASSGHAITPAEWADPYRQKPEEARERILSGEFLLPADWSKKAWMERFVWCLLSKPERMIVEYLVADWPVWSSGFRHFLITLCGAAAVLVMFPGLLKHAAGPAIVGLAFVFGNLVGGWHGLCLPATPGLQSPCYATLPLSFRLMTLTMLKVNLIRYIISVPVIVGIWWAVPALRSFGFAIALKLLVLGLLVQPCVIVFSLSSGTNDTKRLGPMLGLGIIFVGMLASGAIFVLLKGYASWLSACALGLFCAAMLGLYGWFYNHNRFDLVPLSKSS